MKPLKFRSGTNQNDRIKPALQPEYISVEERSTLDLLKYTRDYARKVRFYNLDNTVDGFWSSFLSLVDDHEKTSLSDDEINLLEDERLAELAEFAENPGNFKDDLQITEKYSQPHITMLLAFLKLLKHPKAQFAALTRKHLEYFYRDILDLEEQDEIPDQVHVVFQLAKEVNESLLKKGVLLNAGKDTTGLDLHYEAREDVVLNRSEVSGIKTIHFNKSTSDLKFIHLDNGRGDEGFEAILCVVLDRSELPSYRDDFGTELEVDAGFLRTVLYDRIKGKERDELAANDAEYIFDSLSFPYLKDFWSCLDVFYREMNKGYVGISLPEETEWEEVYALMEGAHRERISRVRRKELKEIHKTRGFEAMMDFAFGEPNPGDMLFAMPANIKGTDDSVSVTIGKLQALALSESEAARKYIENQLCMTVDDFRVIMQKKDKSLGNTAGNEVYTLLERAWTQKRNYQYPSIGSEFVEGYYADSIYSLEKNDSIPRFNTFGKSLAAESSKNIKMGFAVASPLLLLNEGRRSIELFLSAREGSLDHQKVSKLLTDNKDLFNVFLSTKTGWQQVSDASSDVGRFITKHPVRSLNEKFSRLVCDAQRYNFLNDTSVGWYIVVESGQVYEIEEFIFEDNKILLSSVYLTIKSDQTSLVTALIPAGFIDSINGTLIVGKYDHFITHTEESFSTYHEGRYLVDAAGKIFLIKSFLAADRIEVRYCGTVDAAQKSDPMTVNRIWESIEPEFETIGAFADISDLKISEIVSDDRDFRFEVSDSKLRIEYPVDPTGALVGSDIISAWNAWLEDPDHHPGRFKLRAIGTGSWKVGAFTKQVDLTGETIQRYESLEEKGLRVLYRGRPADRVFLVIHEKSMEIETCRFLIAGGVLEITPGKNSFTANQVAADWHLWSQNNNKQGFDIESKDTHEWDVSPKIDIELPLIDKRIKYTEIRNLYGNGVRVSYTGPGAHQPTVLLKENEIDLFDFEVVDDQQLVVKYPLTTLSSAHDLVQEWEIWQKSELNDPGRFELSQLGDGLWEVEAKQTFEFQAVNNQIIECALRDVVYKPVFKNGEPTGEYEPEIENDTGIIALFRLTGTYTNAKIELKEDPDVDSAFRFEFDDDRETNNGVPLTQELKIWYPKLKTDSDHEIQANYQTRHVQECLSAWNRLEDKHNLYLIKREDNVTWTKEATDKTPVVPLPDPFTKDFSVDLTYVTTVHPDGFKAKYDPRNELEPPFSIIPYANLVITENNTEENEETENFEFLVRNDYPNNLKILFVKYPTKKSERTVKKLLDDWKHVSPEISTEFTLEKSGTGKWRVEAVSEIPLTSNTTHNTPRGDEAFRRFFSYNTNDVNGFTVNYSGPIEMSPELSFIETDKDVFEIEVESYELPYYRETFERQLRIKYPKRRDKRRLVELFKAWNTWKGTSGNLGQGFEIIDTAPIVHKRHKARLLSTGDRVREFKVGGNNGLCFTYIGHRRSVDLELAPIMNFSDKDIGQKILWDNGEIFNITERSNSRTVVVEPSGSIDCYDKIQQYEADAFCLNAIKFNIEVEPDFPPIVPNPDVPISQFPMLRVLFNNDKGYHGKSSEAVYYDAFNSILLEKTDLKVAVKNLKQIKTRGHVAMINPQNPYYPFGSRPEKNARFYFANREICEKRLDSLDINLHWNEGDHMTTDGVPDMEAHYYAYSRCGLDSGATIKNVDFEVDLQFKDRRTLMNVSEEPRQLLVKTLSYKGLSEQTYQGALYEEGEELPKDPLDWQRYYKMELADQGFLREISENVRQSIANASNNLLIAESEYNNVAQEIQNREASVRSAKINEAEASANGMDYIPPIIPEARPLPVIPENDKDVIQLLFNEPYSPFVDWISIDYTASSTARFYNNTDPEGSNDLPVSFFRYHPFGYSEISQLSHDEDDYLLPHYEKQGYLNIGVSNIKPLQTLSLLVQMVSGSGDAHLDIPKISWSYLSADKWLQFKESHVLSDKTYGLQDTGIIRFSIPEDATLDNTVMPSGQCWIRAEAQENITAVPDIIDIKSQAVLAQYVNKNNDPERLESPLSAETIGELVQRDSAIKGVKQPYSSFRGKKKEESRDFYIRISERLKHKQRALTLGDYENLILAKFSEIYKVKALPQGELQLLDSESEGEVVIVVILKNKNATPFFPLKPKTPANILQDIEKYIKKYMPPLVSVRVVNPRFEEIQYRLAVKFNEGKDFGFYINQLNEDIKQFLSPWAYSNDTDISFGSSVYSSSIINHIENTDYVDYIANFTLLRQIITHEQYTEVIPLFLTEDNAATAKYPDSILVSAENHVIDVIHTDLYDANAFRGIGYMKIGTDFWISRPGPIFSVGIGEMQLEEMPVMRYAFYGINVTVTVKAMVGGSEHTGQFPATISQKDSEKLWKLLIKSQYIDKGGNVLALESLFAPTFRLEFENTLFDAYLATHRNEFDFGLELTAADFVSNPDEDVPFDYEILTIHGLTELESKITTILKEAIGFSGLSQFPFLVY